MLSLFCTSALLWLEFLIKLLLVLLFRFSLVTNVAALVIMEETKEVNLQVSPASTSPPPTFKPVTNEPLPWVFEVCFLLLTMPLW